MDRLASITARFPAPSTATRPHCQSSQARLILTETWQTCGCQILTFSHDWLPPSQHLGPRFHQLLVRRSSLTPAASHDPTAVRFEKNLAAGSQSHPKMAPCVHSLKHEHKPPAKAIKHTRSKTPLLALRSARTATLIGPGVSLIASEQKRNQTSRHQLMQPQNLLTSAHAIRSVWHKDGWPFCARNPITSFHCSSQRPHGRQQWTAFLLP